MKPQISNIVIVNVVFQKKSKILGFFIYGFNMIFELNFYQLLF